MFATAAMVMHLYQVVGRHLPVEKKDGSVDNAQKIFRMKGGAGAGTAVTQPVQYGIRQ